MLDTVGVGLPLIASDTPFDVPPPGPGVTTVMVAAPMLAMSAWDAVMVSCAEETNAVVRGDAFQFTCDAAMKPLPLTVSVNDGPPAITEAGEIVEITGTEFPVTLKFEDAA